MALGSTQTLTEMSKGGRCVKLTNLPPSCAVVMKSGNLNFLEPSGPLWACNGTAALLMYKKVRNFVNNAVGRRNLANLGWLCDSFSDEMNLLFCRL